jgi:hypothetical protein
MVIERQGGKYVLKSKTTGKVLGKHRSKTRAEKQERAIQAAKHARGKG